MALGDAGSFLLVIHYRSRVDISTLNHPIHRGLIPPMQHLASWSQNYCPGMTRPPTPLTPGIATWSFGLAAASYKKLTGSRFSAMN